MLIKPQKLLFVSLLASILLLTAACGSKSQIVLKGKTETNILAQNIQVSGQIVASPIEAGQSVKKGDLVAKIDATGQEYLIDQLQAEVAKKRATLNGLNAGNRSQEIEAAASGVEAAKGDYSLAEQNLSSAKDDYEQAVDLGAAGAIPASNVTDLKTAYNAAKTKVSIAQANLNKAKEQLKLLQSGAKSDDLAFAQADLAESLSKLAQAEDDLKKFTLTATCGGMVVSKNYLLGDVVSPGYDLADIANTGQIYVIAYLPEQYVNVVNYGQEITVKSGNRDYKAKVSYIALKAEYTPEDLQTTANKNKQNIEIKLKLINAKGLKPAADMKVYLPIK